MDNIILIAIAALGGVGFVAAVILFFIAKTFKVYEDPNINTVEDTLPAANCGACGFPGCRAFAEATVKSAKDTKSLDGLNCPVGGNDTMQEVGTILGLAVEASDPLIAVIRCNGTPTNHPAKAKYEGATSCAFAHALSGGEGGCQYSCLGLGDCEVACDFDALFMNSETGLPVVNDKCTACNACVVACPRDIIELRKRGPKERRIFVSCVNAEKGGPARKNCQTACIGCGKCEKVCKFDAITITSFLAYINFENCTLCRKCVEVCPTNAIWEVNFKPRKPKAERPASVVERKVSPTATEGKPIPLSVTIAAEQQQKPENKEDNKENKE